MTHSKSAARMVRRRHLTDGQSFRVELAPNALKRLDPTCQPQSLIITDRVVEMNAGLPGAVAIGPVDRHAIRGVGKLLGLYVHVEAAHRALAEHGIELRRLKA